MGRTLIITEKPSVGRDIAKVLGCAKGGKGYLSSDAYLVSWAVGHLVALCEPDEIDDRYKKWNIQDLPILPTKIPLKVLTATKEQYQLLKKLMNDTDTDKLVCATDAGREGELIFRYIYEKSGCRKPFDRLWISSLTDEAIKTGFSNLQPSDAYQKFYESAKCRSESDWLVGMNLSRAYTLRYNTLLSIGRVQTPTLAILVNRKIEIDSFVREEYYNLTADFGDYKGTWFNEKQKNDSRINTLEEAEKIKIAVTGKKATVTLFDEKRKQEFSPLLYDLTTLQRDANRLFGYTAKKTLSLAQKLYETRKAITYPRTDSRYLSKDMYGQTIKTFNNLPEQYQHYTACILQDGKLPFSMRVYNTLKVTDHHAIIPTPRRINTESLSVEEKNVYDLIVRRTLSVFYPPYVFDAQTILTACGKEMFRSTGRFVHELGWKAVEYSPKTANEKTQSTPLPRVEKGDERTVLSADITKESTKPPSHYTDGTLLHAMERAGSDSDEQSVREMMKTVGLGTPATRASIIERLCQVGYVQRKGKLLIATQKGEKLIKVIPGELSSPEMTGFWEQELDNIIHGQQDPERFMQNIRKFTSDMVISASQRELSEVFHSDDDNLRRRKEKPVSQPMDVTCPLCARGTVRENSKAFYCSHYREGCRLTIWKNALARAGGPEITSTLATLIIRQKNVTGSSGTISLSGTDLSFKSIKNADTAYHVSIDGSLKNVSSAKKGTNKAAVNKAASKITPYKRAGGLKAKQ
ncbi:MAG: DNA topoisomerase 3 [Clostridia bacterium]|nr:DNA topoisomerase 3 [Clostridia bacterium]